MSQEFDINVLNLVKQKVILSLWIYFKKFNEELPSKKKFISSFAVKKNSDEEYEDVQKVCNKFKTKTMKNYHHFYLNSDVLFIAYIWNI